MRAILTALMIWAMAPMAAAQDGGLSTLLTGDDARGWEAVGRVNIEGRGFCTGALIAPDQVLTAAHCLYDRDTGARIAAEDIQFLAGWRNDRALAYRDIRRAVTLPDYRFDARVSNSSTRHDLALLELTQPIRLNQLRPFETSSAVRAGDAVGVVSYAHDRADAPALEETCTVMGTEEDVIVISCDVDYGSSGAPIFQVQNGQARIVSVVSAKATLEGAPVALGTALLGPLAELRRMLEGDGTRLLASPPGNVRVITPGQRVETGARFIGVGDR